jgi:hypothetical protein
MTPRPVKVPSAVTSAREAGHAAAHAHGRGAGAQKKPSGHGAAAEGLDGVALGVALGVAERVADALAD